MIVRQLLRTRRAIPPAFTSHLRGPIVPQFRFSSAPMSTSSAPQLQHVKVETEPGIAVIKYSRPKSGNALNTPTLKDIFSALKWADGHEETRVIITTGEGKFYTAGLDLLDPVNQGANSTISDDFVDVLSEIHKVLINSNKLLISAVNGPAPGWGTSSLALTDLVYSTPDAIFFTPFVQWGLCAEACSSYTFTRILGRQKAAALILAGQRMTPQELESAGLITKIFPKDGFLDAVLDVARGVCKLPKESLRVNKELMMRGTRDELLRVNDAELKLLREQSRGQESKDAIRSFAESQARKKEKAAKESNL